jgi:hypothetical protein
MNDETQSAPAASWRPSLPGGRAADRPAAGWQRSPDAFGDGPGHGAAQPGRGHARAASNFSDDGNVLVMVMLLGILGLILLMVVGGEMGKLVQPQGKTEKAEMVGAG